MVRLLKKRGILVGLIFFFFSCQNAWAQYPNKPINFIMPFPAGGSTDVSCRPLVQAASRILGRPINIEYHPGGSGAVGLGILKSKKPDGYTIGMAAAASLISQHMRKVNYDTLKDFIPIMKYAEGAFGLAVRSDSPWKTLAEFVEYVKANPWKIRYASPGPGDSASMVMRIFAKRLQLDMAEIPFEGGPQSIAAILGGHVEAQTGTMLNKPHVKAGKLRLLATYGEKRVSSFPDVPTLKEMGFNIVAPSFYMILGPTGLSPEVVEKLNQAFKEAMDDPEFIKAEGMVDHITTYLGPQDAAEQLSRLNEEIESLTRDLKKKK
jgi:tripartite-type tricarboxylate transporter receptor subunit TctC